MDGLHDTTETPSPSKEWPRQGVDECSACTKESSFGVRLRRSWNIFATDRALVRHNRPCLGMVSTASYLGDRSQRVHYNGVDSRTVSISCGVPQGSVLGPAYFLLYSANVFEIARRYGFLIHGYADDLQLWPALCIIWYGFAQHPLRQLPAGDSRMDVSEPTPAQRVEDWSDLVGVTEAAEEFDVACCPALGMSHLAFNERMQSGCHCRLGLNFLWPRFEAGKQLLLPATSDTIHTKIFDNRLDSCSCSSFGAFPARLLQQSAGGHLGNSVESSGRCYEGRCSLVLQLQYRDHVTTLIRDRLHWLDAASRITYKLCVLVFCCRNGLAPRYLVEHCVPVATIPSRSKLRSAAADELCIPRCLTTTLGPRAFAVSGPSSWNSLPSDLMEPGISLATFKEAQDCSVQTNAVESVVFERIYVLL